MTIFNSKLLVITRGHSIHLGKLHNISLTWNLAAIRGWFPYENHDSRVRENRVRSLSPKNPLGIGHWQVFFAVFFLAAALRLGWLGMAPGEGENSGDFLLLIWDVDLSKSICIYIYIKCIHPYSKTLGDLGVDSDLFWNKHRKKWEDCVSWQVVFKGKARSRSTKQMGFPFKIVIFRRTLENHGCPIRCPIPSRKMGTTRDGSRPIKHEDAIK